jgi:hypothetical protein
VAGTTKIIDDGVSLSRAVACGFEPRKKNPLKLAAHLIRRVASFKSLTGEWF